MHHLRASIEIDAPPQQVWDLDAEVEGSVEWVPFAEEILFVSGPAGLGQVYRERTRVGGISDIAEWTVIEWDPPRRQVQQSLGKGMDSRLVIAIEPSPRRGSIARQEVTLDSRAPGSPGWLHERLFGLVKGRGIESALRAAKARMEAA
ncbi:MAG TPA: SRPBCC family protein [Candidatus Limnocylindria bacterium]|nr:SRPBCC family protein [Candidatus Limnocylindria bacterium]